MKVLSIKYFQKVYLLKIHDTLIFCSYVRRKGFDTIFKNFFPLSMSETKGHHGMRVNECRVVDEKIRI